MNVLVLCTGNSARSILLEALLNRLGDGRITAYSAGSQPTGAVHPQSLKLLASKGYDLSSVRSKSWDEFAEPGAPKMDAVITVCASAAGETCPIWPGAPVRAHWGVDDPAATDEADWDEAFHAAYARLERRARAFLDMPVEDMEAGELKLHLDRIGELP
ncbi:arsenate reductase ArsC [Marimonas arenosa]|uniref:Arsenate reductase ArsC n=1 Tax=Marimonas arenosa TaxID=1795305 RepID=A0AAE3W9J5_9RHOB|nr:arsenate reductase ArsC [Marimonas arenosa]MDQ2088632.1 arsenate reductase ArsC [Marimonas arenosa]